eukprot:m.226371 g.226371  ORF g.226371 m.226371 type:complete len:554 (-) comp33488_c5_seq1:55-1716(-)
MAGIVDFYAKKCVFITGGTGFIGKLVIEKLLRSCPTIDTVYVLARPKKGVPSQQRVDDLLNQQVFTRAKEEQPGCEKKVVAVGGDITEDRLGLCDEDINIMKERVTIIIHIAATVKFDEPLKVAAMMNIISVKNVITVARLLNKCESFVHTSTAYTHTYRENLPERILDPTYDAEELLKLLDLMSDDVALAATDTIRKGHPNTYTFTKCCAENMLLKMRGDLPLCIVRPSIVTPAWQDPYPGWTDTYNGPTGLVTACGTGLLRVVPGNRDTKSDTVPVDIVVNTLVTAAWHNSLRYANPDAPGFKDTDPVYNCTIGGSNPITWGHWIDYCVPAWQKSPLEKRLVRTPSLAMFHSEGTMGKLHFLWFQFASHYVPGRMLDVVAKLSGKREFSTQAYERIDKVFADYKFFLATGFTWDNDNLYKLNDDVPEAEKKDFFISVKDLNWKEYIANLTLGIKRFKMKEDVSMRRLSEAKIGLRNVGIRGTVIRILTIVLFVRSLISFGYVRANRLLKGQTWLLIFALGFVSREMRYLLDGTLRKAGVAHIQADDTTPTV